MPSGRSTGKKIKTTRSYNDSLDYQLPVIPLFLRVAVLGASPPSPFLTSPFPKKLTTRLPIIYSWNLKPEIFNNKVKGFYFSATSLSFPIRQHLLQRWRLELPYGTTKGRFFTNSVWNEPCKGNGSVSTGKPVKYDFAPIQLTNIN